MKTVSLIATGLLLGAGLVAALALERDNTRRRAELAELRQQRASEPLRSAETIHAMAVPIPDGGDRTEIERLQAEIAALEKRASDASNPDGTDAPVANRDPEKGMTRLENFANVGQDTPAKAFQTLAWAAMKGDEQALVRMIGVDEAARRRIDAFIALLPENVRESYATPEKVMALFLSKALVNVSALEIAETTLQDPQNATITVRGLLQNDQQIPMRRGPAGWQLLQTESNVAWALAQLGQPAADR